MVAAIADLPLIASGKVREIYDLGGSLLLVASDRISTYDVVHPTPIPDKGAVLTGLSTFWFEQTGGIVAGHLESVTEGVPDEVRGRAMVVKKLRMLPVECIVRGIRSRRAMDEVPGTQPPLLTLDEQQALAGENKEVLLCRFGVVEAVRLAGRQNVKPDAELVKSAFALSNEHSAPDGCFSPFSDVEPLGVAHVHDEPAVAGGGKA